MDHNKVQSVVIKVVKPPATVSKHDHNMHGTPNVSYATNILFLRIFIQA